MSERGLMALERKTSGQIQVETDGNRWKWDPGVSRVVGGSEAALKLRRACWDLGYSI